MRMRVPTGVASTRCPVATPRRAAPMPPGGYGDERVDETEPVTMDERGGCDGEAATLQRGKVLDEELDRWVTCGKVVEDVGDVDVGRAYVFDVVLAALAARQLL